MEAALNRWSTLLIHFVVMQMCINRILQIVQKHFWRCQVTKSNLLTLLKKINRIKVVKPSSWTFTA